MSRVVVKSYFAYLVGQIDGDVYDDDELGDGHFDEVCLACHVNSYHCGVGLRHRVIVEHDEGREQEQECDVGNLWFAYKY